MTDSIDSNYRDNYTDPYASQRKTSKSQGQTLNMLMTEKAEQSLSMDDFLNMMIVQMKNQDFTNPMDDSQMLTQMAQFSTMQQMQELAAYSKSNYVASLVGKTVTAAKFNVSGDVDKQTGVVEKISLVNNEYKLYVNGTAFSLEQVMELKTSAGDDVPFETANLSLEKLNISSSWAEIKWPAATEDEDLADKVIYSIYYSKEDTMSTVEEIEKDGTLGVTAEGMTSTIITGLEPETTYYVNVIAEDANGNKSCYKKLTIKTEEKKTLGGTE